MHYVERGCESNGLEKLRERHTQNWVDFYESKTGEKPKDTHWTKFSIDLAKRFFNLCAYCEDTCKGEVDHFRPKSRFPSLIYTWSNLVLACHDCNNVKGSKWPEFGFVDPCAELLKKRPECVFGFETKSGEIVPLEDLGPSARLKASTMIHALRLNDFHHLQNRLEWLELVELILSRGKWSLLDRRKFLVTYRARSKKYSSIVRYRLAELDF